MTTQIESLRLVLDEMRRLARLANVDHAENKGVAALEQVITLAEQPAQQQEPFTYYRHYDNGLQDWPDEKTIPLYTTQQAQPLTAEQIGECIDEVNATSQYGHHNFG